MTYLGESSGVSEHAWAPGSSSLVSKEELTSALVEAREAVEVLRRQLGVINAWTEQQLDDDKSAQDVGKLLLGASRAAEERMAEVRAERDQILSAARQQATSIVSAAEEQARIVLHGANGNGRSPGPNSSTGPRVDATVIMPRILAGTDDGPEGSDCTTDVETPEEVSVPEMRPPSVPRVDSTLVMPKVNFEEPSTEPLGATTFQPRVPIGEDRAARMRAALQSFIEANTALAEDVARTARR
jgi:hypothetical protein